MTSPESPGPPASPLDETPTRLEAELLACLEAADTGAALEAACARRPEDAVKLRKVWARMQLFGLDPKRAELAPLPERVGPFEVLEKLGEGGMGVVYRCRQQSPDRVVAVKVVRPELLHFEGKRARFDREILATAKLSHPNIVPVLEVGEDGLIPYFSMEYVVGASLAEILAALRGSDPRELSGARLFETVLAALSPADREGVAHDERAPIFCGTWTDAMVSVASQVARAIEHAHARDVLHRDLKPSNIMLTPDGRALVVDFGLARVATGAGAQTLTRSTSSVGSLPYMPPEALRGEAIDARVDVYGLAVTLYEALALDFAFLGNSIEDTRRRVLSAEPAPLRARNADVPWDLETVCATAMAPEPRERYASMRAFREDLDRLRARLPIEARRPGPLLRLRRWQQRNPAAAVGIATAITLLMLSGFALYFFERNARLEQVRLREVAERVLYVSELRRAHSELDDRNVRRAVQILRDSKPRYRSYAWRHLMLHSDAATQSWRVADDGMDFRTCLELAPDNKFVLYTAAPRSLTIAALQLGRFKAELSDQKQLELDFAVDHIDVDPSSTRAVVSSPDGRRALVVTLATGARGVAIDAADQSAFQCCFGPSGSKLYTACADGRIAVRDAASGELVDSWAAREAPSELDCRLAMPPSRAFLVTSAPGSDVTTWELDGSEISTITTPSTYAPVVHFGRDERELLLVGAEVRSSQTFVHRYRVDDGSLLRAYNLDFPANHAVEHPSKPWLAVLGQAIQAIDSERGGKIRQYLGPTSPIAAGRFDRLGKLWTLSKDGLLRRWSLSEPSYMSRVPGHRSAVTAVQCTRGGDVIVSGDTSGRLVFTDVRGRRRRVVDVCDARTQAIFEHGARVWAVFLDGTAACYSWDGKTQHALTRLGAPTKTACRVGEHFYTGHEDERLRAWSTDFEARPSLDVALGFEPSALAARDTLLAVGGPRRVALYRPGSAGDAPRLLRSVESPGKVSVLELRDDGRRVVLGGRDVDVWIHDVESGETQQLGSHKADTSGAAFLPDAGFVATASWSGEVHIWDTKHMEQRGRFPLFGMYLCMSASPRGDYIALGNIDAGVHVMWFERQ